ncbi:hypothetical protein [Bacillus sp. FJAT-52991]|uniref:Uncharacterized protein n=1 Tax=Bacillus kandeliae TaxID=3129297 RepID=A0ABZ2NAR7_9BACI
MIVITLIENNIWKVELEEKKKTFRFKISHTNVIEITSAYIELD